MSAALEEGEWSAASPGRTLPPGKDPVPILQEAGWTPGPIWTGGKSRPHRDSIPDCPARSQSLYRLSYLIHTHTNTHTHIYVYIMYSQPPYIHIICYILKLLIILDFKVVNQGKVSKYIRSTHNTKSQHKLLQIAHPKAGNNLNWSP